MTTLEIIREYKKWFILVIETAGEQQNNSTYKNVEKILSSEDMIKVEEQMENSPYPLDTIILLYISALLLDMYGDKLEEWGNLMKRVECYSIYDNYLKNITDKFTRKMGLPKVDLSKRVLIIGPKNDSNNK